MAASGSSIPDAGRAGSPAPRGIHTGARSKWLEPSRQQLGGAPDIQALIRQYGRDDAWEHTKRGTRWRLGKFYLSTIRELDLLTRLRELGVPLKYHLLADVLLRVDFWTASALVSVYFENRKYRGRKRPAEHYFTGLNIINAKIERQGFGRFWLAKDEAVRDSPRSSPDSRYTLYSGCRAAGQVSR